MTIYDCVREAYVRLGLSPAEVEAIIATKDAESEVAAAQARAETVEPERADHFIATLMILYTMPEEKARRLMVKAAKRIALHNRNN